MRKLIRYLSPYKKEAILGPLFKMLEAFFELLVPLLVANIVNEGIANGDRAYILQRCAVMLIFGVVGLVCSLSAQFFSAKAAVGMSRGIRHDLFARVGKLSFAETDRFGASTLLSRATADVGQVQTAVNLVLRLFLRSPFIVFGAMVMSFIVSPRAALVFLVTIPALSVVIFGIMLVGIPLSRKVQGALDRVVLRTRENLEGARVVRAFVREDASVREFVDENRELTHLQRFSGRFSALLNPLTYAILNLSILAIIYLGGKEVNTGNLRTGDVIALYNYMSQILVELVKLANFIIIITKACACAGRINEVLEAPEGMKVYPPENGDIPQHVSQKVEFCDVSLAYSKGAKEALSHIDFSIPSGKTVGIIGGTGSGKSSLVHLIPRFYDVSAGAVKIDGKDVRTLDERALRSRIGVVPQKAALFSGTIRENLLWGDAAADDDALFAALDAAVAGDFVRALPGGLDYRIEQGGRNLSGGQKQRLTIARALVRRPEILILDDSASALDYATDAALRRRIAALPFAPTVFIVSQRTASIRDADLILVLENGEIIGKGTHEELLETCPVYREIHTAQFGNGEEVGV